MLRCKTCHAVMLEPCVNKVDQHRLWMAAPGLTWLLLPDVAATHADRLLTCAWGPSSHESILQAPSSFGHWLFTTASPLRLRGVACEAACSLVKEPATST